MALLERYRDLRLDLGDAARSLLYLARARKDEAIEAATRRLLRRLAEDRFTIAVVGQHSRGKTTLVNALLGAEFLPTGILPMTSVITLVRYGSEPRAVYFRRGSDVALHTSIADVPALVARESARRAELEVVRVELEVPADLLRLGLTFVDTPGVGSFDETGAAITRRFLPEVDAALFVTSVDSALTDSERALLRAVPPSAPVFCVVNKADLATTDEMSSVVAFVDRALRESRPGASLEVLPLSALQGLRHRLDSPGGSMSDPGSDDGMHHDGGLDAFQARLEAALTSRRAPVALATALDMARGILDDEQRMLDLGDRFTQLSEPEAERLSEVLTESTERASSRRARIIDTMRDDAQVALDSMIAANRLKWHEDLVASGSHAARAADDGDGSGMVTAGGQEWWSAATAQASEASRAAILRHSDELGTTLHTVLRSALEAVGLSVESPVTSWDATELPGFGAPRPESDDKGPLSEHAAGFHTRTRRRREQEADRLIGLFDDHLHQQNDRRAEWIEHEATRIAAGSRARVERYLATAPSEFECDAVARIGARLDAVTRRLSDAVDATPSHDRAHAASGSASRGSPDLVPTSSPRPPNRRMPFDCVVCAHERNALIEDLRHRQLLIATRERDQGEFARIGGLCAQHTWAYASLASPVGIASAYAPLAAHAAEILNTALTASEVRGSTTLFGGNPETCPVCRTIMSAEQEALSRLESGGGDVDVCMRHLGAAAAADLPIPMILGLARRLATNLSRHAEDMRAFTLKREAIAASWLTAEENDAYQETLLMISGDPILARSGSAALEAGDAL
ncbi:dynamin family protein [Humibacter albus]|uniref:dynamin family protein n=1 Tax=Humibacter albus TaxID=427754 RepID=UPI0003B715B5|nr:dynamin family protein [Humibacter albus]